MTPLSARSIKGSHGTCREQAEFAKKISRKSFFYEDLTNDSLSAGTISMDSAMFQNVQGAKILMKKYLYNRKP
jgi:hypothetical protein